MSSSIYFKETIMRPPTPSWYDFIASTSSINVMFGFPLKNVVDDASLSPDPNLFNMSNLPPGMASTLLLGVFRFRILIHVMRPSIYVL